MKKKWALFGFYLMLSVFQSGQLALAGENPLLELGVSKEQTIDLLNVCFSKYYYCKILTREKDGKQEVVVLVGEKHDQPKEAFLLGAKLLRHFQQVGLEGTTIESEENPLHFVYKDPTMEWKNTKRVGDMSDLEKLNDYSLLGYESSLSENDSQQVSNLEQTSDPNAPLAAYYEKKLTTGYCKFALGGVLSLCGYLGQLAGMNQLSTACYTAAAGTVISSVVDIARAVNTQVSNSTEKLYNIRNRDKTMATNLKLLSSQTSQNGGMAAAAMGDMHVYGVSKFLMEDGFIDRADDVMKQYQTSLKKFSAQLEQTTFRNLSDPLQEAEVRRTMEATYPEDFRSVASSSGDKKTMNIKHR